jgi:hypothetical protein
MTKLYTFLIVAFFACTATAQTFEGKIVYKNTYKSKMAGTTDAQFTALMGSIQEYFIKNGDYKSVMNGTYMQWQLYRNTENKLYNKLATTDTIFWNDGAVNADRLLKTEINKNVTKVLGYACDEIIFTCKSGTYKYYYNGDIQVDPALFVGHLCGNWHEYLAKTYSLPLKLVVETDQFSMESVATEVKAMDVDPSIFQLPKHANTKKNP